MTERQIELLMELHDSMQEVRATRVTLAECYIAKGMSIDEINDFTEWLLQQQEHTEYKACLAEWEKSDNIEAARENAARCAAAELALFRKIREWDEGRTNHG